MLKFSNTNYLDCRRNQLPASQSREDAKYRQYGKTLICVNIVLLKMLAISCLYRGQGHYSFCCLCKTVAKITCEMQKLTNKDTDPDHHTIVLICCTLAQLWMT